MNEIIQNILTIIGFITILIMLFFSIENLKFYYRKKRKHVRLQKLENEMEQVLKSQKMFGRTYERVEYHLLHLDREKRDLEKHLLDQQEDLEELQRKVSRIIDFIG